MMQDLILNTTLHTKDGRLAGNAIVIGWTETRIYYKLMTDYGNITYLKSEDIPELFYLCGQAYNDHKHYVDEPCIVTRDDIIEAFTPLK